MEKCFVSNRCGECAADRICDSIQVNGVGDERLGFVQILRFVRASDEDHLNA